MVSRKANLARHHDDLPQDEGGNVPATSAGWKASRGMARVRHRRLASRPRGWH